MDRPAACVLRLGCFLLACLVLYFVPPFSFQPFQMFTSALNERSRSNPLCDFRLGTVVTSDYETPLTVLEGAKSRRNLFSGAFGFFFDFSSSEKFKTSPLVSAHPNGS